MSILIILPFSAPFFLLDVDQPAEELSATINAELWNMPADFLAWLLAQGITPGASRFMASIHGDLVIITPQAQMEKQQQACFSQKHNP